MFFTQFPELQEADISCPVIAGDATKRGIARVLEKV
jgi:hypothetical protein